jgi:hypothetical protein
MAQSGDEVRDEFVRLSQELGDANTGKVTLLTLLFLPDLVTFCDAL